MVCIHLTKKSELFKNAGLESGPISHGGGLQSKVSLHLFIRVLKRFCWMPGYSNVVLKVVLPASLQ